MLRPLIHFLLLGSLCFAASLWWSGAVTGRTAQGDRLASEPLEISPERLSQLTEEWVSVYGSSPTHAELQVLRANELDDEILFREALRLELNRTDPVVRQRLIQNMSFLTRGEDVDAGDEAALLRGALELGMDRSDLVVRRRLIQRMQSAIESRALEPSDGEIRLYIETNPEEFRSPRRYRVSYAYESGRTRPGDDAAGDESTRVDESRASTARELPHTGLYTQHQLVMTFGQEAGRRLPSLERGSLLGPITRDRGRYWLRVDEVIQSRPHAFENVRDRAAHEIMLERRLLARSQAMAELRPHYHLPPTQAWSRESTRR